MITTLADRLKIAMEGPPKVTQAKLARACGVKPPSVNDWLSGKTTALKADSLLKAATFLKVRPRWLADGIGPKDLENPYSPTPSHSANEPSEPAQSPQVAITTTLRGQARKTLEAVPEHLIVEAIAHMEWLIDREKKWMGNKATVVQFPGARKTPHTLHRQPGQPPNEAQWRPRPPRN